MGPGRKRQGTADQSDSSTVDRKAGNAADSQGKIAGDEDGSRRLPDAAAYPVAAAYGGAGRRESSAPPGRR